MSGYSKNIAVIKEIKKGFSADGGVLSGVIRAEQYGDSLKVEASLINFAPLVNGRYVMAIGDGNFAEVFEGEFSDKSRVDTKKGFAVCIYFVNAAEISPIAVAVCGNYAFCLPLLKGEVERAEGLLRAEKNVEKPSGEVGLTKKPDRELKPENRAEAEREKPTKSSTAKAAKSEKVGGAFFVPIEGYEDEAIAEENYYEFDKIIKNGSGIRTTEKQTAGQDVLENEENFGDEKCFYQGVKEEVESLLKRFPVEENLTRLIEHSRWVRISYDDEKYYVFGVIYGGENPQYLCYGVPSESRFPSDSLKKIASFVPVSLTNRSEGYWITYQDATTGKTLKKP